VYELEDITRGIGELDLFDNIEFVEVFKLDDITRQIGQLDFFDNNEFL
jgi:hypothetical protein